jgi:hypothetical protein
VTEEPAVPEPTTPGHKWVDGHIIAPEVIPLYEQIGFYFIGKPLTEWRYNPYMKRYEQYFERLGFYRLEGRNEVHLLQYGRMGCQCPQNELPYSRPENNAGSFQPRFDTDPTFAPFIEQLGVLFTGYAISPAYRNKDGRWEQIFERVVLVADEPMNQGSVRLRPLAQDVRVQADLPRGTNGKDVQFFKTTPNSGYDIPNFFWDYLTAHGGLDLSGPPITHVAPLNGQVMQQCFANLCLMFDVRAHPSRQVLPTPLGQVYKNLFYRLSGQALTTMSDKPTVWERQPVVATSESQEISVRLMSQGRPVVGAAPLLIVHLPDGSTKTESFPATNSNGLSTLRLAPIEAPNGTLILYEVCPTPEAGKSTCTGDSFIIWNMP